MAADPQIERAVARLGWRQIRLLCDAKAAEIAVLEQAIAHQVRESPIYAFGSERYQQRYQRIVELRREIAYLLVIIESPIVRLVAGAER